MMKLLTVFVLLAVAVGAAVGSVEKSDTSNNDVTHDFQEDVHLNQDEAVSKTIDLDDEAEELSGDYYDDDEDDDYEDDDYDDADYDDDDYDEDDDDWEEGSGDEYDDDDYEGEYIDAEDNDKTGDQAGTDLHFATDDKAEEDDLLYEYNADLHDEEKDYDFSKEEEKMYQPPQVQIREHYKPGGDDSVSVGPAEPAPGTSTSRNLLISVFVASGLASFALFTLAFVMCFCHKRTSNVLSEKGGTEKGGSLPFVIHPKGSHTAQLPTPPSSIIKGNRYQPVPTHENRSNHSIENANSLLKSQQLEEKLLLP